MTKDEREGLSVLRDLLSLVLDKKPPTLKALAARSFADRVAAERWAIACHLRASDNNVRIPLCPRWLEQYR